MAKYKDPKVRVARQYSGRRQLRNPAFPFQLRTKPYQIQPFMLAPVLPGETLSNLVCMSRVVTKPLKHALIGWWCEYYFFYVRLRDIEYHLGTAFVDDMVTSPGTYDPAPLVDAVGDAKYYSAPGAINWMKAAMETCVEYFFRDEGEDWDVATMDGLPLAQIGSRNWLDSLTLDADKRADRDVNLDLNDDGDVTAQEFLNGMQHWQALREAGLESLDYEDWIKTFGVSVPEVEESFNKYRPELVRYWRQWQYPTNTVEPSTGVPSSAVSWVNAFRADKDRLFKEPGFVIGLTVQKPKAYLADPKGQLAGFMQTLEHWLPALSHKEYERGFQQFDDDAGPLAGEFSLGGDPETFSGYWVDMRDLLVYGDQFLNFAPDAASGAVSVITDAGGARYASTTAIDALFAGDDKYIQTDGIVNLAIKGRQKDNTPGRKVL